MSHDPKDTYMNYLVPMVVEQTNRLMLTLCQIGAVEKTKTRGNMAAVLSNGIERQGRWLAKSYAGGSPTTRCQ